MGLSVALSFDLPSFLSLFCGHRIIIQFLFFSRFRFCPLADVSESLLLLPDRKISSNLLKSFLVSGLSICNIFLKEGSQNESKASKNRRKEKESNWAFLLLLLSASTRYQINTILSGGGVSMSMIAADDLI